MTNVSERGGCVSSGVPAGIEGWRVLCVDHQFNLEFKVVLIVASLVARVSGVEYLTPLESSPIVSVREHTPGEEELSLVPVR